MLTAAEIEDLIGTAPANSTPANVTGLPDTVSAKQLAALLGLHFTRVYQLTSEGKLPRTDNRYPIPAAVIAYIELAKTSRRRLPEQTADEKTRLTAAQADMAELKLAQTRGELLPSEEVRRAWVGLAIDLRARLLAIVPRLTASQGLDRTIAAQLDAELRAALEDIADDR